MFADQLSRRSMSACAWYCGWDRYVALSATGIGVGLAAAAHQLALPSEASRWRLSDRGAAGGSEATGVDDDDQLRDIAKFMLIIVGLQLVSMFSLSVLRDRSVSLQHRPTLIAKVLGIAGVALASLTAMVLAALLSHRLRRRAEAEDDANAERMLVYFPACGAGAGLSTVLSLRPDATSFLPLVAAILCAFTFLNSLFHLLATLWIIFQRAVFLSPPPGVWDDPEEIKALNWICTDLGDVIPTIYMLPPSVHRQHRDVSVCMLYSHGNAMDLADTVYTLRALAETFDCAVLGYEYPGYGMCSGSISEARCYSAIAAAAQCLVDYHKLHPRQIVLYGRSLGTGPSVHYAARAGRQLGGLILQSPLASVLRTVLPACLSHSSLPFDMFCSIDKIGSVEVPTFITHGRLDRMVPFSHGEQLHRALPSHVRLQTPPLWVDDSSHNDMPRPWLMTEEHAPHESDRAHAEKLRRNRDSRVFIARVREFLATVRAYKEQVDREEERVRVERREFRAQQLAKQESERKVALDEKSAAALAAAAAAANAAGNPSSPHHAIGAGAQGLNGLDVHAIELGFLSSVPATSASAGGSSVGGAGAGGGGGGGGLPSPHPDGSSGYAGPVLVTGGKAGADQFKHVGNHAGGATPHGVSGASAKLGASGSSATAKGSLRHDGGGGLGGGSHGSSPTGTRNMPGGATTNSHADREGGAHHGPSDRRGGGHQRTNSSLRFSDQQYLSPVVPSSSQTERERDEREGGGASGVGGGHHGQTMSSLLGGSSLNGLQEEGSLLDDGEVHDVENSQATNMPERSGVGNGANEDRLHHARGDERGGGMHSGGGLGSGSGGMGGLGGMGDGMSPNASRRPSLTENTLSVLGGGYGLGAGLGSERAERSHNHHGHHHLDRDRETALMGTSVNYNPRSDRFMVVSDRGDRIERDRRVAEHLRGGDRDISERGFEPSRNELSRTAGGGYGYYYNNANTSALGGGIEVSRFGADTQQRLHSTAVRGGYGGGGHRAGYGGGGGGEHSPQSMSRSISISNSMQSPSSFYSHIPLPGVYAGGASERGGGTTLAPVISSSNLAGITSGGGAHNTTTSTTGGGGGGGGSSTPSPPAHPANSSSSSFVGPSTPPQMLSTLPSATVTPVAAPVLTGVAGSGATGVTTGSFSPATILAPNPALVPLSLAQLQELMDTLRGRERAERERVRAQAQRERERDRVQHPDAHTASGGAGLHVRDLDVSSPPTTSDHVEISSSQPSSRRPPVHRSSLERDKLDVFSAAVKDQLSSAAAPAVSRARSDKADNSNERENSVSISSVGHRPAVRTFHHQHTASSGSLNHLAAVSTPLPRASSSAAASGQQGDGNSTVRSTPSPQSYLFGASPMSPPHLQPARDTADDAPTSSSSATTGAAGSVRVELSGFTGDNTQLLQPRKGSASSRSSKARQQAKNTSPAQLYRSGVAGLPPTSISPPPTGSGGASSNTNPSRVVIHGVRSSGSASSSHTTPPSSRSAANSPIRITPPVGTPASDSTPPAAVPAVTPPTLDVPAGSPVSLAGGGSSAGGGPIRSSSALGMRSGGAGSSLREESASGRRSGGSSSNSSKLGTSDRGNYHAHFAAAPAGASGSAPSSAASFALLQGATASPTSATPASLTSSSTAAAPMQQTQPSSQPHTFLAGPGLRESSSANSRFHRGDRPERSERASEAGGGRSTAGGGGGTGGGEGGYASSRLSQHRASVSGYDVSLMSRSRSGSRWPYSLNDGGLGGYPNDAGVEEGEGDMDDGVAGGLSLGPLDRDRERGDRDRGSGLEEEDEAEFGGSGVGSVVDEDHSLLNLVDNPSIGGSGAGGGMGSQVHSTSMRALMLGATPRGGDAMSTGGGGGGEAYADVPIAIRHSEQGGGGGGGGSSSPSYSHSSHQHVKSAEAARAEGALSLGASIVSSGGGGSGTAPGSPVSSARASASRSSLGHGHAAAAGAPKAIVVRPGSLEGSMAAAEVRAQRMAQLQQQLTQHDSDTSAPAVTAAASTSSSASSAIASAPTVGADVAVAHQTLSYVSDPRSLHAGIIIGREDTTTLLPASAQAERPRDEVVAAILQPISDAQLHTRNTTT